MIMDSGPYERLVRASPRERRGIAAYPLPSIASARARPSTRRESVIDPNQVCGKNLTMRGKKKCKEESCESGNRMEAFRKLTGIYSASLERG